MMAEDSKEDSSEVEVILGKAKEKASEMRKNISTAQEDEDSRLMDYKRAERLRQEMNLLIGEAMKASERESKKLMDMIKSEEGKLKRGAKKTARDVIDRL